MRNSFIGQHVDQFVCLAQKIECMGGVVEKMRESYIFPKLNSFSF